MTIAKTQYDERKPLASDLSFQGDKGVTKQADLKDADINAMFKKFERTGQLPNMIAREPRYGDFTAVPDYQEALEIVKLADEQFTNLDVTIRNRFANDPSQFLAFATDPNNIEELEKMGLLNPTVVAARKEEKRLKAIEINAAIAAAEKAKEDALIAKIKAGIGNPA